MIGQTTLILTAPDLALRHVEEEAELAVLAALVAAAAPGDRLPDVSDLRMRGPRGSEVTCGQQRIRCQGRAVSSVSAAVEAEAGPGGSAKQGGVDHKEVTWGTREDQLRGVTS